MCDNERDALDLHFYASDPMQEELEIEFNSRYDYIAELKAEHEESPEMLAAEAAYYAEEEAAEAAAFIGPRQPVPVFEWQAAFIGPRKPWSSRLVIDDDIPF